MKVGETSQSPARESRRARLSARRFPTRPRRGIEDATGPALLEAGLDLFDRLLGLLGRLGGILAADHLGHRLGDRLLAAQRAHECALTLLEAPRLEVLHSLAERFDRR